jgi:diadenosine tetraphosphate (Ap4A) HIT family hydrolase
MFHVDKRIIDDSIFIKELKLSNLYLKKDAENPWCILVPKRKNIMELTDLQLDDQQKLLEEINLVMKIMQQEFSPGKMNIGALGNVVAQFHFHIIARYENDRAWPNSIWGTSVKSPKSSWENWPDQINKNL